MILNIKSIGQSALPAVFGLMAFALSEGVFADTTAGTLKAGSVRVIDVCGNQGWTISGYSSGSHIGSYSPTGLTGGETVVWLVDTTATTCAPSSAQLGVSGFTSNPGATWLTSITCNGIEKTGSTASFTYNGTTATWIWNNASFGFVLDDTYSCSIVYN
jgi:hypothetical protein